MKVGIELVIYVMRKVFEDDDIEVIFLVDVENVFNNFNRKVVL